MNRRTVLAVVAGVLLAAGLIAIPIVSSDEESSKVDVSSATTVPPADPSAVDGGDPPPSDAAPPPAEAEAAAPAPSTPGDAPPTTVGAASAPTTTPAEQAPAVPPAAAPAEDLGPPSDPGPATPPRAGRYEYRTEGKSERGSSTSTSSTEITETARSATEVRQLVKIRGAGLDSDSDVAWRSDGVFVLKTVFMFGQSRGECDWSPDVKQAALPMRVGLAWETSTTCTVSGLTPTPVVVTRKLTGKVTELRRVRVAGQVLDVWAVESTDHIEFAGTVIDTEGTSLFSPKLGLVVRSSGKASGSGSRGSGSGTYSTELLNTEPK